MHRAIAAASRWRSPSRRRARSSRPIARKCRRDEARHHLHGRESRQQGRLRVVVSAGHDAAVGRNGSHADDDLDPAAGHAVDGASLSRCLSRHRRRLLLSRGGAGRIRADVRAASIGRLELHRRFRRRSVAAKVVRHRSARTPGGSKSFSTITATPRSTMPARRNQRSSSCVSTSRRRTRSTRRRSTRRSSSSSTANTRSACGRSGFRRPRRRACTACPTTRATRRSTTTSRQRTWIFC